MRLSLVVRKLNFAADWKAVGRRCVVDPLCCEEVTQIPLPCGTGCNYTLPSTMYVTFTGQTRIPDGSYAVRHVGNVSNFGGFGHHAESVCFGQPVTLQPTWAAGTIDLYSLKFATADTFNDLRLGPKNAVRIGNDLMGHPRYLSLYVVPCCWGGGAGITLTVSGFLWDVFPQPGGFFDGVVSGYCAAPFLTSISGIIALTDVLGINCAPLLPALDLPVYCGGPLGNIPGTFNVVDITE